MTQGRGVTGEGLLGSLHTFELISGFDPCPQWPQMTPASFKDPELQEGPAQDGHF